MVLAYLPSVMTVLFLLVVFSYYVLLLLPSKRSRKHKHFDSISVIVPAHNEGPYLAACLESIIAARFPGRKEIIVVDDGSIDDTKTIALRFKKELKLISTEHQGKSASINRALKVAKGQLIAIVDGDSVIHKGALLHMRDEVSRKGVVAATGIIRVKNRSKFICIWVHIEQLYNSLIRSLMSKVNANISTPGPLSVYRRKELLEVGGFSTEGFSEDLDITIRLIRAGHRVGFAKDAIADTNMPYDVKGFFRQRTRFARGMINMLRRHLRLNTAIIDIYTLPLFLFTYIQAVIMGSFTLYQVIIGYNRYFLSEGIVFSGEVVRFFFEWFSIVGFVRWAGGILTGDTALGIITLIGIVSTLLTYPLYILAILQYDRKVDLRHLIALFFMAPFWLLIMVVYILMLPELFRKQQYNRWKKNEQ